MTKKAIKWAAREKRLSVNRGVGKSFLKTVTEPVTNADSISKKKAGVDHSAGLVPLLLNLRAGQRVDSAQLKQQITSAPKRMIRVEVITAGANARRCRVIDYGSGMTLSEIERKFGDYASAKAKGEKTRSLFGRGALDVLLYHEQSTLYSVSEGVLSRCKFFWEDDTMYDPEELGKATAALLKRHDLPRELVSGGTVVEFTIVKDTSIPSEDAIIDRLSSFYMLRLIAADPNTNVVVHRLRSDGPHQGSLSYDFPVGLVLGRYSDTLTVDGYGSDLPVDILVARSDVPLMTDADNIDRRVNGLLFVDENDAVLDLTLTGEFDKSPYLRSIYGIVRIIGIREVLEAKLEDKAAEAILTPSRDGFDRRNPFAIALFKLVEKHVRPLYDREEKNQRKGEAQRPEAVTRRLNDALKAFNQFNAEETEEAGDKPGDDGPKPPPRVRPEALYFDIESTRLHAGVPRRLDLYINLTKIPDGEIVLFEATNPDIKLLPDSATVDAKARGDRMHIGLSVTCDVKGEMGVVEAITLDKDGKEQRARVEIRGVDDAPVPRVPDNIEFTAGSFSGTPNRQNKATLLVNLDAFTGKPEITFLLEDVVGSVSLAGVKRITHKVSESDVIKGSHVARITVPFEGTAWGQRAVLFARAKRGADEVRAKCRLKFEQEIGNDKFSDVRYDDLGRPVLGDVAENILYINSGYPLHRDIFGDSEDEFNRRLESDRTAQMRAASILVETVIYHAAVTKWQKGGKKGLDLKPSDPVGSIRSYVEESRMRLEGKIFRALVAEQPNDLKTAS